MIILQEYLFTFGWAIVGSFSMAIALIVMMKIFSKLTPFDEWEEIRKGNMAVAVTVAAVLISAALVISNVTH